ncbi:hypothetical protein Bbelb_117090 [Branchiostoma belcheri]|nr:hypothetical protein Bbelb_117090 [Branchiostoma belcheri]
MDVLKLKFVFAICCACVTLFQAYGSQEQGVRDNKGTEFILTFTENLQRSENEPALFITTQSATPTTVNITLPATGYTTTVTEVNLTRTAVELRGSGKSNKAVHVTSAEEIVIYGVFAEQATSDAYLALPKDVLGTEYFVACATVKRSRNKEGFKEYPTEFGVVGVSDGTTVTINPTQAVTFGGNNYPAGQDFTVSLDRFETLQVQATEDLTGSRITSTHPVSVLSGNLFTVVGNNQRGSGDYIVEMIPPVNTWGKEFVTAPLAQRTAGDIFRVVAARDNTQVTVTNRPPGNLGAGDFWELEADSTEFLHVIANEPVLLAQYSKTAAADNTSTDPFLMIIPPVAQFEAVYTFSTIDLKKIDHPTSHHVNLVIQAADKAGLVFDGRPLPGSTVWHPVPGTTYQATDLTISAGTHTASHSSPDTTFGLYSYGYTLRESYGYPGGLRLAQISAPCTATQTVGNDRVDNDCDGRVDEELPDGIDNDGDGLIDEDLASGPSRHILPIYAFTANTQWIDVFSTMKGTGQTVYDAWSTNGQVSHNKCPIVDQWESLNIQRVKVVLESSEGNVELIFDGRNTDKFNWFSKPRLLSSPWNDISTEHQNYFSIEGAPHVKRSFYINRNWDGCPNDAGWLMLADGGLTTLGVCEWERASEDQLPYIRFSKTTGYAKYNGGNIATADRMVIYIDTPGNNVLCSCPAGQSLSEDGNRCEAKATVTTRRTCFCVLSTCKNVGKRRASVRGEYRLRTESYGFGSTQTRHTDECAVCNGGCEQTCTNTPGGFLCSCQHGYTLNRDGLACDDVNECEVSPGICGGRDVGCVNLNGSFDCKCLPGFRMGAGCEDVDECSGRHTCPENAFCVNQPGSYYCVCRDGFTGNGTTCTEFKSTTTPPSPTTTVKSTAATTPAEYTTPQTTSTVSTETSTSSAAPSTTSTSLKASTTKGDAIELEETTTSSPPTPIVTFVSHEPPEASKISPKQTRTINTIADLQYDKDDPGSILDQLIPYIKDNKRSSSEDRRVDSTTCTDAMAALARLSRASSAEDSTETLAMITRDVIALCGTLSLDAQAEGGYVVGAMADSIKRGALGGASMEELAPTAAAVVDTVSSLMESGGLEAVSEDQEDIAALHRLPPRKRKEFRQKMKEKLREKQERQWTIQKEVTQELQRNLDSIADALLDSKGGTGRVDLGSRAVQMVLEKTSGGRLGGAAVSAHAGGVTFPGSHALHEGGVVEDAAMKASILHCVVGYDRNPYVWDESAKDINSSVVDIELKQPGRGTLKVKDLSEDITVVLKNAPDMFSAPRLVKYSPFPNDTMVFRTFSARRNQSYGVLVSLVAPYPGAVMYGKLGDFPNETDYDFKKEFSWDDFIAKTVLPHGDVHITYTVLQPDTAGDKGTEEYTIGLQVDGCPPEGCPYSVDITRLDCVFWDPGIDAELGSWKRDGCRVSPASTLAHTVCLCDHLTGFGTSGGTEPNRINFKTVFSKFQDLVNNYAVWTTMVVVMGMYFVMIYPARRKDKADEQKWSIKNVHGNRRRHRSRFLVRVDTGHDWGAGTRSKVVFVLTGDKGSTGPRSFQQDDMTFQTGSVDTFLLTTPQKLGGLTSLTVWHDNSGEGRHASWFLERVEVINLQTNKKIQFVCNDWLGVEHGDGCLKRTLPPTAETDVSLGQRFSLKLREKFKDGHVWLSVVTSRPKSYFSRVQMITSAMWFRVAGQGASSVVLTIGSVELTAETLLVSLWTTLQVFPVNFIIVQIFRRCRPKGVPKSSGLQLPYWSVYVGWTLLVLTTLASGFFLMLYSMEWGRDKSIQWLTAFGLSFLQSMVVVQPAEAVILAFGTSVLCACRAKSDTDDKDKDEDVEAGKRQPTLPAEPLTGWSELEETELLKQQRAERKNWLQLTNNGRQCILGFIIITAAILMVHEVWNPSAPAINQGLKDGFSNGTNLVKTQKDVLPWLKGAFARKLYPTHQYNGDALDWKDSIFISDMPAYRVGPVRLGQFRARTGMCDVAKPALHANKTCVMPCVSGIAGEAAASFPESSPETFSHVLHGTMGSYGGPGYRVNLGEMQAEMMETLRILEANRWIDPYTAALVLDLTLYHVNANLFSTVCVLFEFPPSAGAIVTLNVSTFPLTAQGIAPTILFVAKAVFVACLLYVIIRLVKNARQEGRSFILQVWSVVEVASIVTSLYVIVAMASKDAFAGKAKSLISQELQKGA